MSKSLKAILSRELNWMLFRVQGAQLYIYKRTFPAPLKQLVEQYDSIRKDIIATVKDPEFRDIYYKANGVKDND